jgi:hypothetical protein
MRVNRSPGELGLGRTDEVAEEISDKPMEVCSPAAQ